MGIISLIDIETQLNYRIIRQRYLFKNIIKGIGFQLSFSMITLPNSLFDRNHELAKQADVSLVDLCVNYHAWQTSKVIPDESSNIVSVKIRFYEDFQASLQSN